MLERVITLRTDTTVRWSCRRGDFVLWLQAGGPLARQPSISVADFWELRDGDFVTITNRAEDLPVWFELHPSGVRGSLAFSMMAKLNSGWEPPDEPMDAPNLWRLKAGDRVAWVGESRPGQTAVEGILAILDCRDCALAIGESNRADVEAAMAFGSLSTPEMRPEDVRRCQAAVEAVGQLGSPRTWSPDWAIG